MAEYRSRVILYLDSGTKFYCDGADEIVGYENLITKPVAFIDLLPDVGEGLVTEASAQVEMSNILINPTTPVLSYLYSIEDLQGKRARAEWYDVASDTVSYFVDGVIVNPELSRNSASFTIDGQGGEAVEDVFPRQKLVDRYPMAIREGLEDEASVVVPWGYMMKAPLALCMQGLLSFQVTVNSTQVPTYLVYTFNSIPTYVVAPGDRLVYSMYHSVPGSFIAMDVVTVEGNVIRSSGVDQNGVSASYKADYTSLAGGKWYKREISLNPLKGQTINRFSFGLFNDSVSPAVGSYGAYFTDIKVVDQFGNVRVEVYGPNTLNMSAFVDANSGNVSGFSYSSSQKYYYGALSGTAQSVTQVRVTLNGTSTQYIEVPDVSYLNLTTLTAKVLFKLTASGATQPLVTRYFTGHGWEVYVDATGHLVAKIVSSGGTVTITSAGTFNDGQWHVGGIVIDGVAKTIKLITDDTISSSSAWTGTITTGGGNFRFGSSSFLATYLNGSIGGVALYNYVMSSAEWTKWWPVQETGFEPGLVGVWSEYGDSYTKFNEFFHDHTLNANHARYTSGALSIVTDDMGGRFVPRGFVNLYVDGVLLSRDQWEAFAGFADYHTATSNLYADTVKLQADVFAFGINRSFARAARHVITAQGYTVNEDVFALTAARFASQRNPEGYLCDGGVSTRTVFREVIRNLCVRGSRVFRDSTGKYQMILDMPNSALTFDGSGDNITWDPTKSVNLSMLGNGSSFAIEWWMKVGSLGINHGVFGKRFISSGSWEYSAWITSGNVLSFGCWTPAGTAVYATVTGSVPDTEWHHYAVSADGSNILLYRDGVQIGTAARNGSNVIAQTDEPFSIGRGGDAAFTLRDFNGSVDEFRMWNVNRSAANIQAYWNKELTEMLSGLSFYCDFNNMYLGAMDLVTRKWASGSGNTTHLTDDLVTWNKPVVRLGENDNDWLNVSFVADRRVSVKERLASLQLNGALDPGFDGTNKYVLPSSVRSIAGYKGRTDSRDQPFIYDYKTLELEVWYVLYKSFNRSRVIEFEGGKELLSLSLGAVVYVIAGLRAISLTRFEVSGFEIRDNQVTVKLVPWTTTPFVVGSQGNGNAGGFSYGAADFARTLPGAPTGISVSTFQRLGGDGSLEVGFLVTATAHSQSNVDALIFRAARDGQTTIVKETIVYCSPGQTKTGELAVNAPGKIYDLTILCLASGNDPGYQEGVPATSADQTAPNTPGAPTAPSAIVVRQLSGKGVEIEPTFTRPDNWMENRLWRHTSNTFGSATMIAHGKVKRFVDANVSFGTQYFYWVTVANNSNQESGASPSSSNSITPSKIPGGSGGDIGSTIDDNNIASLSATKLSVGGQLTVGSGGVGSIRTKIGASIDIESSDASPGEIQFMTSGGTVKSKITGNSSGTLRLVPASNNGAGLSLGESSLRWSSTVIKGYSQVSLEAGNSSFATLLLDGTAFCQLSAHGHTITVDTNGIELNSTVSSKIILLNGRIAFGSGFIKTGTTSGSNLNKYVEVYLPDNSGIAVYLPCTTTVPS